MRRNRPRLNGFLTGVAVTALCVTLWFQFGLGERLELQSLDIRFRSFGDVDRDSRIVHVDIDDNALDRIGRWPWPRLDTADLVRTIHELGASVIAIDLLIDEPQTLRRNDPSLSKDHDVEPDVKIEGQPTDAERVYDDIELADALRTAGSAFISIQAKTVGPGMPDPEDTRIRRLYEEDPGIDTAAVIAELGLEDKPIQHSSVSKSLLRERIRAALLRRFTLSEKQLERQLKLTRDDVLSVVAGVKAEAANELVARIFAEGKEPTFEEARQSVLGESADTRNADRQDVLVAFRRQNGLAAMRARSLSTGSSARGRLQRAVSAEPPLAIFVEASCGF
ncbi:MAG: CHASE2 domain-containing protein, partial [Planctomycetota bacterium]|nr:CHASE2 domain-containing protein [Planctomycetota bacterium]